MEYIKIFNNNNRVTSATPNQRSYTATAANFSMRFVFNSTENYTLGKRQLALHNDSFIILNKGTQFTCNADPYAATAIFSIEFGEEFLSSFIKRYGATDPVFEDAIINPDPSILRLRETIYPFRNNMKMAVRQLKQYLDNGIEDTEIINSCLERCLLAYYKIYNEEIHQKASQLNFLNYATRMEILRRLNLAREYLYTNYNRNVSLESLADHACLSVNHLLRTFKLAYNQSPHQFLIHLRLQRAQLLLTKTEYPVYEIVNMVGFKCTSSFIRLFRNRYKTTPLKYRNVLV